MHVNNGHGTSFDTAAAQYDRWRPLYAAALFRDVFSAAGVGPSRRALEIGAGTGQATRPVLETGCDVTALEPGRNMACFLEEKFKSAPNFRVICETFEDFSEEDDTYDLIFAATAFHWIPEEIGYRKVFQLLKSGGVFARFANHPCIHPEQRDLFDSIQALYARYLGRSSKGPQIFSAAQAEAIAAIADKYGFVQTYARLYQSTHTFTGADYVGLLGTYSDHLALEEQQRAAFFSAMEETICAHGDRLILLDTMDLQLAYKP